MTNPVAAPQGQQYDFTKLGQGVAATPQDIALSGQSSDQGESVQAGLAIAQADQAASSPVPGQYAPYNDDTEVRTTVAGYDGLYSLPTVDSQAASFPLGGPYQTPSVLPEVETTATVDEWGNQVNIAADELRDNFYNQQAQWAYDNHMPAPPTHADMQQLASYNRAAYAATAPAYSAWVAASTSHVLPTEEERSLMARQYIFSDPTGQRQADFFNYSDEYWLKLAAIPAAAGAGLGVVGGVLGTEAVVASAKVGGSIGAVNGYISGGWKGAVVGGIFGTGLGAGVGTAVDLVEAGTLLRGAAFVVGNGVTSASTTIATNAVVGDPLGKDVGWSIAVGMASIFGSGAVVAETLGGAIIGNRAIGAIRAYANSLSVVGTAADPNSTNGLNPQPDNDH